MADIPFTQYLRPDGRMIAIDIDRPDNVAAKAELILAAGLRFECEQLSTGHVSLTISDNDGDYAFEVVVNGPEVPPAVDRLVLGFDLDAHRKAEHG